MDTPIDEMSLASSAMPPGLSLTTTLKVISLPLGLLVLIIINYDNDNDNDNPPASVGPPGPLRSGQTPATSAPPSGENKNSSFRQVYFKQNQ